MTATYTNDPSGRTIDQIRYLIDDKDCIPETDALLSDEEIQYEIDSNSSAYFAAASAAESIAAKYASDPKSKTVDDFTLSYGDTGRSKTFGDLARRLRARGATKVVPYAGGLSKADKATMVADTDRVQPVFTIGMDDHTGSVDSVTTDF